MSAGPSAPLFFSRRPLAYRMQALLLLGINRRALVLSNDAASARVRDARVQQTGAQEESKSCALDGSVWWFFVCRLADR